MLINRIFNGNDAVYGLTVNAVDEAVQRTWRRQTSGLSHTAYCLPCYYAVTGVKVEDTWRNEKKHLACQDHL